MGTGHPGTLAAALLIAVFSLTSTTFADFSDARYFSDNPNRNVRVTEKSGIISSHSEFPAGSYPAYVNAAIIVTGLNPSQENIMLIKFDTPFDVTSGYQESCSSYLRAGNKYFCNVIMPTVGRWIPMSITASSFSFYFYFYTYYNNQGSGFSFAYKVASSIERPSSSLFSSYDIYSDSGYIVSHPEFPTYYRDGRISSSLTLNANSEPLKMLTLDFIHFDLYFYMICVDILRISGIQTEWNSVTSNADYCGNNTTNFPIGSHISYFAKGSMIYFEFITNDAATTASGFLFKYSVDVFSCEPSLLDVYSSVIPSADSGKFLAICDLGIGSRSELIRCSNQAWESLDTTPSICFSTQRAKSIQRGKNLEYSYNTTDRSGYVLSHAAYPDYYTNNINSTLTIEGLTVHQQMIILFYQFDLRSSSSASNCAGSWDDSLTITGVENNESIFCSSNRPPLNQRLSFTVLQTAVTFRFKTSSGWNGQGFYFNYSVEDLPMTTPQSQSTTIQAMSSSTKRTSTSPTMSAGTISRTTNTPVAETAATSKIPAVRDTEYSETQTDGITQDPNSTVIIGAAVGAGVLLIIVVIVLVTIFVRRKRHSKAPSVPPRGERGNVNSDGNANIRMSALIANTGESDYLYLPEGTAVTQNQDNIHHQPGSDNVYNMVEEMGADYTLAEEVTPSPAPRPARRFPVGETDYDMAGQVSDQARGDYDEYQLAGASGDEYENFSSIQRAEDEREITEDYAPIRASNKTKKTTTELIDNDLYGT